MEGRVYNAVECRRWILIPKQGVYFTGAVEIAVIENVFVT